MIRFQRQRLELILQLAFSAKIDDKFGCMGVPSNNRNFRIQVQAMLIFCLNLELMSIYLNLAFVWGPEICGIFQKPECYMINVLTINCGLIPGPYATL